MTFTQCSTTAPSFKTIVEYHIQKLHTNAVQTQSIGDTTRSLGAPNSWHHQSALHFYNLVTSRLYKWNHTVCSLWGLTSFTQPNSPEIHPNNKKQSIVGTAAAHSSSLCLCPLLPQRRLLRRPRLPSAGVHRCSHLSPHNSVASQQQGMVRDSSDASTPTAPACIP